METQEVVVEPESQPHARRPRLRWYQFRLRSLLLLMVGCALASSGWVVYSDHVRKKREQHEVARLLKGHFMSADFERDADDNIIGLVAAGNNLDGRLDALRGMHYLRSLSISAWSIDEEGFAALSRLGKLDRFSLSLGWIDKADFARLGKLSSLQSLECRRASEGGGFWNAPLSAEGDPTDDVLHHLGELQRLRTLDLDFHFTTNLAWLPELRELESLRLTNAALPTDAKIRFAALRKLRAVDLRHCLIHDCHLSELGRAPSLRSLDLSVTYISDAGLPSLRGLTGLEKLNLQGTEITDAGLRHIAAMPSLRAVNLTRTPVTPDGVRRLKATCPDLQVNE